MINEPLLRLAKKGVRLINVSRGPIVVENDLIKLLEEGHIFGAALDVFEEEPLPLNSGLRKFPNCIFGSHNGSNTIEAVDKTSLKALDILYQFTQEKDLKENDSKS